MSHDIHAQEDGRLDLVPMIDCVMLLLIFFVLTTKFSTPDQAIPALMPTKDGITTTDHPKPVPRDQTVMISAWPDGLPAGGDARALGQAWAPRAAAGEVVARAWVKVGNRDPILVDGSRLGSREATAQNAELERLHRHIAAELAAYEQPDSDRAHQPQVLVGCFSGLPWRFGISLFDAVRAYEGARQPPSIDPATGRERVEESRTISFASPRLRGRAAGEELWEIMHQR